VLPRLQAVLPKNPPGPRRYLAARRFLGAVFARQKTHVILSEVAVRHEVEGSVFCGAFHRAAFQAAGKADSSTAQPAAAPLRMTPAGGRLPPLQVNAGFFRGITKGERR